ncbi:ATP adenylyltransferase C-terminal [Penicillium maclennaniae]|uniref:ATP adenylyltransferase C-terminal n=1 Tax=Penicillium maclennaniae TaxID=1343394 RepID=UPI0025400D09|nr:ATP adenylyltransferase C-terminal [Penicillium maclennaniae]KAJ5675071.1 ATP adenylyltransferase C-terminal [Penicillium maclennaniae]
MQLGLSESLSALVARRFKAAKEGNHLVFSSTHLSIINAGIPYQLRYCPALAKKPNNLRPSAPKAPKPDPFETPSPELLITTLPPTNPSHALILNKYPVIPNHFILATTAWAPQTDLLDRADLDATYECLRAWTQNHTGRLFAFFNSGDESGASQPHRHLQFLPVEAMRADSTPNDIWEPLIDGFKSQPLSQGKFQHLSHLPFAHFALPVPEKPTPEVLHNTYLTLYRAAVAAVEGNALTNVAMSGAAHISYNLAMTLSTMMIVPRRAETGTVPVDMEKAGDIVDPGVVSLNGTVLAGTLMVKAEAEWDVLRAKPELLVKVLREVGFPRDREGAALL